MIQPEVMKAQAGTLNEWSEQWLRIALDDRTEGAGEIGYQLARVARLVQSIAVSKAGGVVLPAPADEKDPPEDRKMTALRDG